jgi:hypothetical protein
MSSPKRSPSKKSRPTTPKLQRRVQSKDSFEAVARRLECDEDKAHFEEKLGKIACAHVPRER